MAGRGPTKVLLLVLALPLLGGCLPLVTHGPAVHPGGSEGMVLSLEGGTTFEPNGTSRSIPPVVPAFQLILRQGMQRGPFGPPFHAGLQLQPFSLLSVLDRQSHEDLQGYLAGSDVDLYTQLIRDSTGSDRGVGVLSGYDHVAPYFEMGPRLRGDGSWFTVGQLSYVDTGDGHVIAGSASIARTESGFRGRAAHLMLSVYAGGRAYDQLTAGGPGAFLLVVG